jgi:ribose transport system substrate-binding protein
MKKFASVFVASFTSAVAVVSLVAGAISIATPASSKDKPAISVIVKEKSSYYWRIVLAGARAAGNDLGVEVDELGGATELDVSGQIKLLGDAVAADSVAIVIAPTQFSALGPAVDEAAKRVPVIVIDSSVASLNMKSMLATDNVQAGRLAADAMAKAVAKKYGSPSGELIIVNYLSGAGSITERSKGFKDQLFAKYPGLTVIDEINGDSTVATSVAMIASTLKDHPDVRGVFATNLITAEVAAEAMVAAGKSDFIKLIGFDSSDKLTSYLADGTLAGLIVQDPFRMGYDGVKTALDASQGRGVLQFTDTGATLITKENMNDEQEQRLLHPKTN